MKRKLKTSVIVLSISLASMVFVFGGCTKYASEEDLQALEAQKQAADAAEQEIARLELEKADLEQQIKVKEQELQKWQDMLKRVGGEK